MSWFSAIDGKDRSATLSHFRQDAGERSAWTDDPAGRTFHESSAPDVGQPDSFWDVDLVKDARDQWLVDNYGQGAEPNPRADIVR